ncbi:hypothetical protein M8Z33_42155 [Streptomyces sp. ZAF1911]|uniref:hypothetical protein n=1 Tax=Streptomyces sp. ZAF1911 TaxID=2944129 RepID=UPI00237B1507|nr:hypothetical protein [Streptomyces sp. ZAF1911]MDD9383143.1 hypothetical protein [Streptomyces sp. ZAF1911]
MSSTPIIDSTASIVRGTGPRSVPVYREMVFGGQLVHALDYVVLTHVLFAIAAGEDITVPMIWKRLQEVGIRSTKNAKELVGKNSVYEAFGRIIAAGFIRRVRLPHPDGRGRKGAVVYEVYEFVSDNPDHAKTATSAPLPGTREVVDSSPLPGTGEAVGGNSVFAGQTTSPNPGSGVPGSGVPERGRRRIPAGQSHFPGSGKLASHPPHPPEGVVTPSPYPLVSQVPQQAPAAQEGEGAVDSVDGKPSADAISEAYEFLQDLPRPWSAGRPTARKLAPLLAEAIETQGWALDEELIELLTDESGPSIRSYPSVLSTRIKDLPRHRTKKRVRPVPGQRHEGAAGLPAEDCKTCYGSGWTDNVGERCPCIKVSVAS